MENSGRKELKNNRWGLTIGRSGWRAVEEWSDRRVVNWVWGIGGKEWRSHVTCATCVCQKVPKKSRKKLPKRVAEKLVGQSQRVRGQSITVITTNVLTRAVHPRPHPCYSSQGYNPRGLHSSASVAGDCFVFNFFSEKWGRSTSDVFRSKNCVFKFLWFSVDGLLTKQCACFYENSNMAPRLTGIKQKKSIIQPSSSMWFLLFYPVNLGVKLEFSYIEIGLLAIGSYFWTLSENIHIFKIGLLKTALNLTVVFYNDFRSF